MKAATVTELKKELTHRSREDLLELCLKLSKFKQENKELLTYHLFEIENESRYIFGIQEEVEEMFTQINTRTYYFMKKGVRKILRHIKKHIRYSKKKETEVELLLHFCKQLSKMNPSMKRSTALFNIFKKQIEMIEKRISGLHEDLQYDFNDVLDPLKNIANSKY